MNVTLTRDVEEDEVEEALLVDAPLYPGKKIQNNWLVVGDAKSRALYGIKKVTVRAKLTTKLQFTLPQGEHHLRLYCVGDSYLGADLDLELPMVKVAEAEESDDDDDESDDAMEE